eukprot:TRINITY_DN13466_c0_g1_i1.p1 TRINITY_DN13466_c0_g1~~TRINITY_DN13466_c0_g1_i1.p1  ORF type:complete len:386 (-),score=84.45 TRINITY_DN13466_c0_g1_i1:128-1246(-)
MEARDMLDPDLSPYDPINIQFTSGTTGHPKGATLTHRGILNNGYFVGINQNNGPDDVLCISVPLYHCFGCVMGNLCAISHGSKMVYPSYVFNATKCLEVIEKQRCTSFYGVPTMIISVLQHPNLVNTDVSTLNKGITGGSSCAPEIMKKIMDKLGLKNMGICYGMTETSPVSFQTKPMDSIEDKCYTVGRVHPHLEVKIIDSHGETVPVNTPGELLTKGYSVMKGYWGNEKQTAESVVNGWMFTGDIAVLDERGYCKIVGRSKDMIIRGGENIYPREVEEFFLTHPSVVDVQVVGVTDEKYGEEVCACVIRQQHSGLNEEDLLNFCKGKIAHYKIPKFVLFMNEFPLTVSGKVQKFKLRGIAENLLNRCCNS